MKNVIVTTNKPLSTVEYFHEIIPTNGGRFINVIADHYLDSLDSELDPKVYGDFDHVTAVHDQSDGQGWVCVWENANQCSEHYID